MNPNNDYIEIDKDTGKPKMVMIKTYKDGKIVMVAIPAKFPPNT